MMNLEKPINKGNSSTYRNLCGDSVENLFVLLSLDNCQEKVFTSKSCDTPLYNDKKYDLEETKQLLSELMIRFDTDPNYYTKDDYKVLLKALLATYSLSSNASPNSIYINNVKQPTENGETFITIEGDLYVNVDINSEKTNISLNTGDVFTGKDGIATVSNLKEYLSFEKLN